MIHSPKLYSLFIIFIRVISVVESRGTVDYRGRGRGSVYYRCRCRCSWKPVENRGCSRGSVYNMGSHIKVTIIINFIVDGVRCWSCRGSWCTVICYCWCSWGSWCTVWGDNWYSWGSWCTLWGDNWYSWGSWCTVWGNNWYSWGSWGRSRDRGGGSIHNLVIIIVYLDAF